MECINFDEQFEQYEHDWIHEHAAEYGNSVDSMEEEMPALYEEWLHLPAEWLGGIRPCDYFARYDDAFLLCDWMLDYFRQNVPVPDLLMDRLTELSEDAERALLAVLRDENAPEEAVLTAISLLTELESREPADLYIRWILQREADDERADMAAEALTAMGRIAEQKALAAYEGASDAAQETLLDILCNFPGNEKTYQLTMERFLREEEHVALFASLLGKLGDERAIPALLDAMQNREINYLDYIEVRNAIEALGGDAPEERDFTGDPYYESLSRME